MLICPSNNQPMDYEENADMLERYGIDSQYLGCLNCVSFSHGTCNKTNPDSCGLFQHLWAVAVYEGKR